jgi:hypothetical protein
MEEPEVSLREITADTVREICRLRVAPGQEGFVAPVAESIAEAYFSPLAWFRAVYAGDTPVGFYGTLGFELTGEVDEDEVVARPPLSGPSG